VLGCGNTTDTDGSGTGGGSSGAGGSGGTESSGGSGTGGFSGAGGASGVAGANGGSSQGGSSGDGNGGSSQGGSAGATAVPLDCDHRKITCRRAEPECPVMQVPRVDGTCFGECVPIMECGCTVAEDCPHEESYTCHRSAMRCGPYV
jgi:hypothetical protein